MRRSKQDMVTKARRRQRGAALAEYGLLVAGVTLASLVAVSVLGGKVGGLVASVATLLPGATPSDNGIVQVGNLIETQRSSDGGVIVMDDQVMLHDKAGARNPRGLGQALGLDSPEEAAHLYQLGDRDISY